MGERLVADQKLFSDAASSAGAFPIYFVAYLKKPLFIANSLFELKCKKLKLLPLVIIP
jgi:hypothetical protein